MKIVCKGIVQIPRILEWGCKNMPKSISPSHILEIFGIFIRGKGSPYGKYAKKKMHSTFCILIKTKNIGLLNFFHKGTIWLKILEKGVKKGKVVISKMLQILTRALD
jgi:hypothetical protein